MVVSVELVLPSIYQSFRFFGFMEIHKAGILEIKLTGIPEIIRKIMSSLLIQPGETLLIEGLTCKVKWCFNPSGFIALVTIIMPTTTL